MDSRCVAVAAGKGGVLKTSIATHLAGLAAAGGRHTLLIDADPQGNAMFDLGYRSDGGAHLADVLSGVSPMTPLIDVRPRLDVVCGGPELDRLARHFDRRPTWSVLDVALRPMSRYDLIVIDTPARELWLRRIVLTAARAIVVPSSPDRASRVGLVDVARTVTEVRESTNPDLDVLGVVVAPVGAASTRIRRRARERLGDLVDDRQLVCESIPRYAPLVAELCRDHGLLVPELLGRSIAPACTAAVAADWHRLVAELTFRFAELGASESDATLAPA